ncbi:MAG: hypothetical protein ACOYKZ_00730 [Chlamydiia bacterium]
MTMLVGMTGYGLIPTGGVAVVTDPSLKSALGAGSVTLYYFGSTANNAPLSATNLTMEATVSIKLTPTTGANGTTVYMPAVSTALTLGNRYTRYFIYQNPAGQWALTQQSALAGSASSEFTGGTLSAPSGMTVTPYTVGSSSNPSNLFSALGGSATTQTTLVSIQPLSQGSAIGGFLIPFSSTYGIWLGTGTLASDGVINRSSPNPIPVLVNESSIDLLTSLPLVSSNSAEPLDLTAIKLSAWPSSTAAVSITGSGASSTLSLSGQGSLWQPLLQATSFPLQTTGIGTSAGGKQLLSAAFGLSSGSIPHMQLSIGDPTIPLTGSLTGSVPGAGSASLLSLTTAGTVLPNATVTSSSISLLRTATVNLTAANSLWMLCSGGTSCTAALGVLQYNPPSSSAPLGSFSISGGSGTITVAVTPSGSLTIKSGDTITFSGAPAGQSYRVATGSGSTPLTVGVPASLWMTWAANSGAKSSPIIVGQYTDNGVTNLLGFELPPLSTSPTGTLLPIAGNAQVLLPILFGGSNPSPTSGTIAIGGQNLTVGSNGVTTTGSIWSILTGLSALSDIGVYLATPASLPVPVIFVPNSGAGAGSFQLATVVPIQVLLSPGVTPAKGDLFTINKKTYTVGSQFTNNTNTGSGFLTDLPYADWYALASTSGTPFIGSYYSVGSKTTLVIQFTPPATGSTTGFGSLIPAPTTVPIPIPLILGGTPSTASGSIAFPTSTLAAISVTNGVAQVPAAVWTTWSSSGSPVGAFVSSGSAMPIPVQFTSPTAPSSSTSVTLGSLTQATLVPVAVNLAAASPSVTPATGDTFQFNGKSGSVAGTTSSGSQQFVQVSYASWSAMASGTSSSTPIIGSYYSAGSQAIVAAQFTGPSSSATGAFGTMAATTSTAPLPIPIIISSTPSTLSGTITFPTASTLPSVTVTNGVAQVNTSIWNGWNASGSPIGAFSTGGSTPPIPVQFTAPSATSGLGSLTLATTVPVAVNLAAASPAVTPAGADTFQFSGKSATVASVITAGSQQFVQISYASWSAIVGPTSSSTPITGTYYSAGSKTITAAQFTGPSGPGASAFGSLAATSATTPLPIPIIIGSTPSSSSGTIVFPTAPTLPTVTVTSGVAQITTATWNAWSASGSPIGAFITAGSTAPIPVQFTAPTSTNSLGSLIQATSVPIAVNLAAASPAVTAAVNDTFQFGGQSATVASVITAGSQQFEQISYASWSAIVGAVTSSTPLTGTYFSAGSKTITAAQFTGPAGSGSGAFGSLAATSSTAPLPIPIIIGTTPSTSSGTITFPTAPSLAAVTVTNGIAQVTTSVWNVWNNAGSPIGAFSSGGAAPIPVQFTAPTATNALGSLTQATSVPIAVNLSTAAITPAQNDAFILGTDTEKVTSVLTAGSLQFVLVPYADWSTWAQSSTAVTGYYKPTSSTITTMSAPGAGGIPISFSPATTTTASTSPFGSVASPATVPVPINVSSGTTSTTGSIVFPYLTTPIAAMPIQASSGGSSSPTVSVSMALWQSWQSGTPPVGALLSASQAPTPLVYTPGSQGLPVGSFTLPTSVTVSISTASTSVSAPAAGDQLWIGSASIPVALIGSSTATVSLPLSTWSTWQTTPPATAIYVSGSKAVEVFTFQPATGQSTVSAPFGSLTLASSVPLAVSPGGTTPVTSGTLTWPVASPAVPTATVGATGTISLSNATWHSWLTTPPGTGILTTGTTGNLVAFTAPSATNNWVGAIGPATQVPIPITLANSVPVSSSGTVAFTGYKSAAAQTINSAGMIVISASDWQSWVGGTTPPGAGLYKSSSAVQPVRFVAPTSSTPFGTITTPTTTPANTVALTLFGQNGTSAQTAGTLTYTPPSGSPVSFSVSSAGLVNVPIATWSNWVITSTSLSSQSLIYAPSGASTSLYITFNPPASTLSATQPYGTLQVSAVQNINIPIVLASTSKYAAPTLSKVSQVYLAGTPYPVVNGSAQVSQYTAQTWTTSVQGMLTDGTTTQPVQYQPASGSTPASIVTMQTISIPAGPMPSGSIAFSNGTSGTVSGAAISLDTGSWQQMVASTNPVYCVTTQAPYTAGLFSSSGNTLGSISSPSSVPVTVAVSGATYLLFGNNQTAGISGGMTGVPLQIWQSMANAANSYQQLAGVSTTGSLTPFIIVQFSPSQVGSSQSFFGSFTTNVSGNIPVQVNCTGSQCPGTLLSINNAALGQGSTASIAYLSTSQWQTLAQSAYSGNSNIPASGPAGQYQGAFSYSWGVTGSQPYFGLYSVQSLTNIQWLIPNAQGLSGTFVPIPVTSAGTIAATGSSYTSSIATGPQVTWPNNLVFTVTNGVASSAISGDTNGSQAQGYLNQISGQPFVLAQVSGSSLSSTYYTQSIPLIFGGNAFQGYTPSYLPVVGGLNGLPAGATGSMQVMSGTGPLVWLNFVSVGGQQLALTISGMPWLATVSSWWTPSGGSYCSIPWMPIPTNAPSQLQIWGQTNMYQAATGNTNVICPPNSRYPFGYVTGGQGNACQH